MDANERLIAYGTLAPGRPNHHQLAGLEGRWTPGVIRGDLTNAGWGDELGYPAIVLRADGPAVDVHVFESIDLPAHWGRLDKFEGAGYERTVTSVETEQGPVPASIYVFRDQNA